MANALEFIGVNKSFGSLEILKGLDFTLAEGKSVAVIGPSGAGKSTFLHIAGLMERPVGGVVKVNGKDTITLSDNDRARERLNGIGFLFQFHHLLPDFSLLENVLVPTLLANDDQAKAKQDAKALLDRLGLSARSHHKPHQLSGGEQQRAGLARALIRRPKLLLCDEPTGNLDPHTAESVATLIWSEVKRGGISTIIVTHNETLARQADASFTLSDGKFLKHNWKER